MKKLFFIFSIIFVIYSCSKTESTPTATPPVVIKLSGCDSIKQGLLKTTSDTLRLLSCLNISANDSMRLGLIKIGQIFQGGIVIYFLVPGNPGYDAKIQHGLIAATSDQSAGISWHNGSYTENHSYTKTGATGDGPGAGLDNTNKIITLQGGTPTSYAAGLAKAYRGGGYNDWYLPSKWELYQLYQKRDLIGGLSTFYYWSSTEHQSDNSLAWSWYFSYGTGTDVNKFSSFKVRAIRSF
jgi:hypothetical protein